MTLSELKSAISSIPTFSNKVAYRAFPVGKAPKLPFVCILETVTENFKADSKVYQKRQFVNIELYSARKDTASEDAIEEMLDDKCIVWDKAEEYIESEQMNEVIYEIVI